VPTPLDLSSLRFVVIASEAKQTPRL